MEARNCTVKTWEQTNKSLRMANLLCLQKCSQCTRIHHSMVDTFLCFRLPCMLFPFIIMEIGKRNIIHYKNQQIKVDFMSLTEDDIKTNTKIRK